MFVNVHTVWYVTMMLLCVVSVVLLHKHARATNKHDNNNYNTKKSNSIFLYSCDKNCEVRGMKVEFKAFGASKNTHSCVERNEERKLFKLHIFFLTFLLVCS